MLNCSDKTVIFSSIPSSEFVIPISIYLNSLSIDYCGNESQGYVLLSTNMLEYERTLNKIPVVREYVDVFLKDILELLLEREIEFYIDLVPEAGLISIAHIGCHLWS